jgi:RNA polymerase sigma-54 factor
MAFEIKQVQKLSQQLVMTPQLQQAIKLLQLSRLELQEVINQEMMENPLLEEVVETSDNPEGLENKEYEASSDPNLGAPGVTQGDVEQNPDPQASVAKDDIDWDAYIEETNNEKIPGSSGPLNTEELPSFENVLTKSTTLEDHLRWQISLSQLTDDEKKFAHLVVGNINEDGYLLVDIADLAKESNLELEDAEEVLKMLQKMDPVGVCSRNLQECLLAQAEMLNPRQELVEKIIQNHLSDLERKNYQAIARALDVSLELVYEATKIILGFEPKPGRTFVSVDPTHYIVPDIYVYKVGDEFVITLNEDGIPKLRVSNYYKSILQNSKTEKTGKKNESSNVTKDYIQDKLRSAVWLIRSIHNRQKTIYKVTEAIVKRQREFFEKGVSALKPMVLKDVAEDIGMHESTVSRVTTNKFVHTPVGTFELKYFFNSSISATDGGESVASLTVKEKIKNLIANEDPKKPLSDQKIVELLKKENIDIARRTVAKYREMLNILPSAKRKKVF